MRNQKLNKIKWLAAFACSWFGGGFTMGCDDDPSNAECEASAVSQYRSEAPTCEEETQSCLKTCNEPSLDDCIWDCEDFNDCQMNFNMNVSSCDCFSSVTNCVFSCGNDDWECYINCNQKYFDCAGEDSPYQCASSCMGETYSCMFECERNEDDMLAEPDMDAYLSCRTECMAIEDACLADCI